MNLEITAQKRIGSGKGPARSVRREALVPAILYGPKTEATSLTVSAIHLEKLLRETGGESKLLNLNIEDAGTSATRQVLI
ncbi:MAG: hypothetical protein AAGU11_09015, partial [Syntrophobacteraceae bacterium]